MLSKSLASLARTTINNTITRSYSSSSAFEQAQANLQKLSEKPDNETQLKLYALFKQSTAGDVTGSRPGMMDFVGRAKFDAWNTVKGLSKDDAQKKYAQFVASLVGEEQSAAPSATVEGLQPVPGLDVVRDGKVFKITLNRPKKFNALTLEMYRGIAAALAASNADKSTSVTVLTANGQYFCSGNDLTNFAAAAGGGKDAVAKMAADAKVVLRDYVQAYIDHEKPLIGLINGPAVGISVTVLGLFDYVIASDKSSFHTPFAPLGQSPEGVSSYTFPLLMGQLRASELLLMCKKITPGTAKEYGLVNEVVADAEFAAYTSKTVTSMASMPPESLRINKMLMRSFHKKQLTEANIIECDTIEERWQSKECHQAIASFLQRSKK